jgi:hypothetical protein
MKEVIHKLIAIYGFKKVYIAMEYEMKQLYMYLKYESNKIIKYDKKLLDIPLNILTTTDKQEITKKVFDRKEHLEQIERKNKENKDNSIDPYSLLTKENLEHWIKEGHSYMRIAREYVGLSDTIIRESARKYNLKSAISQLISQKRG